MFKSTKYFVLAVLLAAVGAGAKTSAQAAPKHAACGLGKIAASATVAPVADAAGLAQKASGVAAEKAPA
jgi:Skp family chaperone for outer membrane proteins